jgi:hypothetical protein
MQLLCLSLFDTHPPPHPPLLPRPAGPRRRSLFSDLDSPEALYQHLCKLRGGSEEMPDMPTNLDSEVMEVLEACLQVGRGGGSMMRGGVGCQ